MDLYYETIYFRMEGRDQLPGYRFVWLYCGRCNRRITAVEAHDDGTGYHTYNPAGCHRLPCHRRCGADWRVSYERLAPALAAAVASGRRKVVLGVDV